MSRKTVRSNTKEISKKTVRSNAKKKSGKDTEPDTKKKGIFFLGVFGSIFILCLVGVIFILICANKNKDVIEEQKKWSVMTQCDFSTDAGATYAPNLKEFKVGATIYMKVLIKAETNTWFKKTQKPIGVTLKIPNVKEIAANYDDGQPITGRNDEINQVTVYEFNVMGSKNPKPVTCIFQFKPNAECDARMTVEYDNQILDLYDVQKTVHFVK